MNRDEAMALLREYTLSESLVKHMLAVEAGMRAYAAKLGEDVEKWGIVGLLHDFDYERWPDPPDHPLKGSEILADRGYPEDVIEATSKIEALSSTKPLRPPCMTEHIIFFSAFGVTQDFIGLSRLLKPFFGGLFLGGIAMEVRVMLSG